MSASATADVSAALQALAALRAEYARPGSDDARCAQLLSGLKLALAKLGFLSRGAAHDPQLLLVAREGLEIGALFSLRTRDVGAFERYMAQLKTFYYDNALALPASERQSMLVGLNLLRLLAQNRIAEFHTELELLPADALHGNVHVRHPVEVERWLMEGAYNKIIKHRTAVPAPEYGFFMDTLVHTMRGEIASCSESAYQTLPLADAAKLMFFDDPVELQSFCDEREWQVDHAAGLIVFQTATTKKTRDDIPSAAVIDNMLRYAQELDRIV